MEISNYNITTTSNSRSNSPSRTLRKFSNPATASKSAKKSHWVILSLLLVFGTLSLVLGILFISILPGYLTSKVLNTIVITSPDHPEFDSLKSNAGNGGSLKFNKLWFYDIRNPQEFLNGTPPSFIERGPYVFREYYSRNNIKFSNDSTLYSYSETVQNEFVPEMSQGSLDDVITTLNLPYIKVMNALGSESNTLRATGPKAFVMTIDGFKEKFIPTLKASATASGIKLAVNVFQYLNGGILGLYEKMGGGCTNGRCSIHTFPPKFSLFLNTDICSCNPCNCSNDIIPVNSMMKLMDPSDDLSFLNIELDKGINLWLPYSDYMFDENKKKIMSHFNLTDSQFKKLHSWLYNLSNSELLMGSVFSKLQGKLTVKTWDDVVFRQFLAADIIHSLNASAPIINSLVPSQPPELALAIPWLKKQNILKRRNIFEWDLETVKCVYEVLRSNESANIDFLLHRGIQRTGKAESFLKPSLDVIPTNQTLQKCFKNNYEKGIAMLSGYFSYVSNVLAYPQFKSIAESNGLVIKRSIKDLVLGKAEPILQLVLAPTDPRHMKASLLKNDDDLNGKALCQSTIDVENDFTSCIQVRVTLSNGTTTSYYERAPSVFYTGLRNPDLAGQLKALNGHEKLHNIFISGDLNIFEGAKSILSSNQIAYSTGESYPPLQKITSSSVVAIFVSPLSASLTFNYEKDVSDFQNLKLKRFVLDKKNFSPQKFDSYLYDMSYANTPPGVLNLTEPRNFRVFASQPHFLGYEKYHSFDGISNGTEEEHGSFLDIEPITGKAMRASMKAQVVVSTKSTEYDLFFPNVYKTDFMPVYWQEIRGEASHVQASKITGPLYAGKFMSFEGAILFIVFGCLLIMSGGIFYRYRM